MKKKLLRSVVGVLLASAVVSLYSMVRLRSVPEGALRCLHAPQQMILYAIDPSFGGLIENPGATAFHGRRILGQTAVTFPSSQRAVTDTVESAIVRSFGLEAGCFNPRHAVRVSDASGTYDFLICFECMQIYIYSGNEQIGHVAIFGWPAPLDAILTSGRVPLASR